MSSTYGRGPGDPSIPAAGTDTPSRAPTPPLPLPAPVTPQAKFAGFWTRFVAYLLDGLILAVVYFVVRSLIRVTAGIPLFAEDVELPELYSLLEDLICVVMVWLYFAIFESSSRQATPGKKKMGIEVTDLAGQRIGFGRATARFWAKLLSALPFWIGFIMAGFTRRKQALHDMLAKTVVVES